MSPFLAAGNPRPVLRAARDADAVLALVLETEGSTYVPAGTMAYFDARRQIGWLSGGCLEPAVAQEAARVATAQALGWMEIDTRGDEDRLRVPPSVVVDASGSRFCRCRRPKLNPLPVIGVSLGEPRSQITGRLTRHKCYPPTFLPGGSRTFGPVQAVYRT